MRCLLTILILLLLAQPCLAGRVNTFIYHRFDEPNLPSTNISSAIFKEQLKYLHDQNIPVLPLSEVVARLNAGKPLPDQAVALTVDDAFPSFYRIAMPLLRQYDFPVTLFVNTDSVGTPGYLDWDQLRELVTEGVEIGNHTASHAYLVEMQQGESFSQWRQRISDDILRAQQTLQDFLGVEPQLFAYTYGEYTDALVELVRELGFKAAFAQQSGVVHKDYDRFTLPRFPMGGPYATMDGFINKLQMNPLVVDSEQPTDPVIRSNPPQLEIRLAYMDPPVAAINCFAQGATECIIERLTERGSGWYRIKASSPLNGRRTKYTLTFRDAQGDWHWYSHLWIEATRPVPATADTH